MREQAVKQMCLFVFFINSVNDHKPVKPFYSNCHSN